MSNRILSGAWLIVAVLSAAAGVHKSFREGFADSYPFFVIFLVAVIIFYLRNKKKNSEENTDQ